MRGLDHREVETIRGKVLLPSGDIEELCISYTSTILKVSKTCGEAEEMPRKTLIVPGGIDIHTHVRGAQLSYKETIETASAEAAYGGVTAFFDMPNTVPKIDSPSRVDDRLREFEGRSLIDYGIYSGVPRSVEHVDDIEGKPVAGFKIYPEDLEEENMDVIQRVYRSSRLKVLHSESPKALAVQRSIRVASTWMELAPLYMARGRIHVTHVTSYTAILRALNQGFTTDVTPHHLLLDTESGCMDKVNPPFRGPIERSLLWKALDKVSCIASDHAPHTLKEKMQPYDYCPPGIATVSFTLPFIYTLAYRGIISFRRALELVSLNPARILGLDGVGVLKPGYRANITIIKFDEWRYMTRFSKTVHTPLNGFRLSAVVHRTIVGGETVFSESDIHEGYPGVNILDRASRQKI